MISLACSLAFTSLLSGAAPAATTPAVKVAYTKTTLPNGMVVVLHEDHSVPRVHMSVRYRVGSGREKPGRTGFAHLFEHLMFEGSKNVPEGKFDQWLEAAGGENNAYTSEDETYYFEEFPSNAADLALFLESDRQGFFVDQLTADFVDGQRDVVKNERRQSYENRPWGNADLILPGVLWPKGHPYSWPVIGSMEDLTNASVDDVKQFFTTWYAPGNAILVIVGDFDTKQMRTKIERWFSDVPARGNPEKAAPQVVSLKAEKRVVVEDNIAPLARLQVSWPTAQMFGADDAPLDVVADILGGAASARLTKRLVHELQIAQEVSVGQHSQERAGTFTIDVIAQPDVPLQKILAVIDEELRTLERDGPSDAEVARARAKIETGVADALDSLSDKAGRLSLYEAFLGEPDSFERDLTRYRSITPAAVKDVTRRQLGKGRVVMSIVPAGQVKLAVVNGGTR
jgi:zinc protease